MELVLAVTRLEALHGRCTCSQRAGASRQGRKVRGARRGPGAGGGGGGGGGAYLVCWQRVQNHTIFGLAMKGEAQARTQIQVTESACVITTLVM